MNFSQSLAGDVRVEFRRADAAMAKKFLNHAQVGVMLQQVRGKTMSQHMGCDVASDPCMTNARLDATPHCRRAEAAAAFGQKQDAGRF